MFEVYNKPALNVSEQIELLQSRGLLIPDSNQATQFLKHVSYYRLSGYTISFESVFNGKRTHQFRKDIKFEDVINLYNFDRHLRILVMDAMERIEVAVRTQVCLSLATTYNDSHWYLNQDLFNPNFDFKLFLQKCEREERKSKERFVVHYKNSYRSPSNLPCWMISELLPMGTWSQVYSSLAKRSDKKKISDTFQLSPVEMQSWLHCLTYIRNLCAHHARLWNRHFTLRPMVAKHKYSQYLNPNHTFAAQVAMMHIFLKVVSPSNKWTQRIYELLNNSPFINLDKMGFDKNWKNEKFWEVA